MTTIYIESSVISGRPGATMQYITSHHQQHSISLVDLPSTLKHTYHTDLWSFCISYNLKYQIVEKTKVGYIGMMVNRYNQ